MGRVTIEHGKSLGIDERKKETDITSLRFEDANRKGGKEFNAMPIKSIFQITCLGDGAKQIPVNTGRSVLVHRSFANRSC
jgi:hypothetical protein